MAIKKSKNVSEHKFEVKYVICWVYLICKGCLPSLRHNDVRDLTASLLTEVCSRVIVGPELQPVSNPDEFSLATSNTQEGARLDVAMNGFWGGQSERCFVDVRVFNPYAVSNRCSFCVLLTGSMKGSSTGLMVNVSGRLNTHLLLHLLCLPRGGLAHEAIIFYKHLASLLSTKWGDSCAISYVKVIKVCVH